ncbi:hypothetical protein F4808DRAFT_458103 [Astrocystis sublimbata]|nr:hypothetical protein F4808DRAFT_458103 [Astrocystis sublimbata]
MCRPIAGSPSPPSYKSQASSTDADQHKSGSSVPGGDGQPPLELAPWQRRWNVEWLNNAKIPDLQYKCINKQRPLSSRQPTLSTRESINTFEDFVSSEVAKMIEAGFVDKKDAHKRTRLRNAARRCTWPLQFALLRAKALKKCWDDLQGKDGLVRVTAVMEEQGGHPRWQAEMTFTMQPKQFKQMTDAGQWIEFPSPEDIKWFGVAVPGDVKRLRATRQTNWGRDLSPAATSVPFGLQDGCIVRNPSTYFLPRDYSLFIEQKRCSHCGCIP